MNHRFFKLLQILIIGFFALILPESKAKSPGLIPKKSTDKPVPRILKLLTPDESGVHFTNIVPGDPELKPESRLFTIASGGVALGDVNGDGLVDIYLTCFLDKNKLYINKGNLKFEEAPASAGVSDSSGFGFGATMVDIDADGDLDIYVTKYNKEPNKLFVNDGKGNFVDKAKEYGLDRAANGIQSTFFDYDLDGDLDVLIMNNGIHKFGHRHVGVTPSMMRNNGDGTFSDVSAMCGIDHKAFGLSATASDVNNDGWPDVFIANDFEEKDYLYINQQNGTFKRQTKDSIPHTVTFGMGNDVSDFNNDGWNDMIVVDMLPEKHERLNTQFLNFSTFSNTFDSSQFVQNVLQLNRRNGRFSDVAQLSGVEATEWSWSSFFADLDNDGWKDIFIANGLKHDIMDQDFTKYGITHDEMKRIGMVKQPEEKDSTQEKGNIVEYSTHFDVGKVVRMINRTKIPNYLFKNNGDLTFRKVSDDWGMDVYFNTCGAAYADLDNDGDLEIVINNIDSAAMVYKNMSREMQLGNYLSFRCKGNTANTYGLGATIKIRIGDSIQSFEINATRGLASSVAPYAHFGLGKATKVDEVIVTWPGGAVEVLKNVKANQMITLDQSKAKLPKNTPIAVTPLLKEITKDPSLGLNYVHTENDYDDFFRERLLPNKLSIQGPALAAGDINGDGIEDLVIGGAQGSPLVIYMQNDQGQFSQMPTQQLFLEDSSYEDQSILIVDVDKDGDQDIYVASGGNEDAADKPELMEDRLYVNEGKGMFKRGLLPSMRVGKSCVIGGDFDKDGDYDLFVGGSNIPGHFEKEPRSFLLLNTNGHFTDVTEYLANGLLQSGMIKSAIWTDYDNDNDLDIIAVGDWMGIKVWKNNSGAFTEVAKESGLDSTNGHWRSIVGGDFDNDGDIDYVVGNLGTNTRYHATREFPLELHYKDYDENGSVDFLHGRYEDSVLYPARLTASLIIQMPTLRYKYLFAKSFADAKLTSIVGGDSNLYSGGSRYVYEMNSLMLINDGKGSFTTKRLPVISQISPIYGMIAEDIDNDGNLDLVHTGNFYGPDRDMWRYDAGIGMVLKGDGKLGFKELSVKESGFYVPGEGRALIMMPRADKNSLLLLSSANKGTLQIFEKTLNAKTSLLKLDQSEMLTHAIIEYKNGKKRRQEFHNGSGHLSQGIHVLQADPSISKILLFDSSGKTRTITAKIK
ncbi:MAG: hypothetical protein RL734_714 [Bacteroidota bacterium]|jgi:hypothetical protein